jgi:hypothetical protein
VAVSAFGFGGSNAHVVVTEAPAGSGGRPPLTPHRFQRRPYWLPGFERLTIDPGHPLAEHQVLGDRIVPGAACLVLLGGAGPVALRDVRLLRPVTVDGPVELRRVVDQDGAVVLAGGAACATGRPLPGAAPVDPPAGRPTDLTGPAGVALDLYPLLEMRSIRVGRAYHLVTEVHRAGATATATVRAPETRDRTSAAIAWLDAVLQCAHAVVDGPQCLVRGASTSWCGPGPFRPSRRCGCTCGTAALVAARSSTSTCQGACACAGCGWSRRPATMPVPRRSGCWCHGGSRNRGRRTPPVVARPTPASCCTTTRRRP